MDTLKIYYAAEGSVRGRCPHKHRTIEGAERCMRADQAGCQSQGGYSDRHVVSVQALTGRSEPL